MTDLKLSQQLVMTPQLQLAIKLLAMKSSELPVDDWKKQFGLEELAPSERDPIDLDEEAKTPDADPPPWFPATESELPGLAEIPDVWVTGNPPHARANRHAYPRLRGSTPDGKWILRSLRQRARAYERVVQAVVEQRPLLGVTLDPDQIEPVSIREIAEAIGMHESTIERVASAVRFQNRHGIVAMIKRGKKLGFTSATPAR